MATWIVSYRIVSYRIHVSMATSGLPYEAVKTMKYTPNISTQHLKSGLNQKKKAYFIEFRKIFEMTSGSILEN